MEFGKRHGKVHKRIFAYSMFEMLIVLIIIAIVIISLPPIIRKLNKLTTVRTPHGRFECWIEKASDGKDHLYRYYVEESANGRITGGSNDINVKEDLGVFVNSGDNASYCEFKPPIITSYIAINAIGGGGAGGQLPAENSIANINEDGIAIKTKLKNAIGADADADPALVYNGTKTRSLTEEVNQGSKSNYITIWPKWLQLLYGLCETANTPLGLDCSQLLNSDKINSNKVHDFAALGYRSGGQSGKVVSAFFPKLPNNVTLYVKPGLGGKVSQKEKGCSENAPYKCNGQEGGDTIVQFLYDKVNPAQSLKSCFEDVNKCDDKCCNLVVAHGGIGGKIKSSDGKYILTQESVVKIGGAPSDFGLSNTFQVQGKKASFNSLIDDNSSDNRLKSRVSGNNLGDGGKGANHYLATTTGKIVFEYKTGDSSGVWSSWHSDVAHYFDNNILSQALKHLNTGLEFDFRNYANTNTNPADCAVREITASDNIESTRDGSTVALTSGDKIICNQKNEPDTSKYCEDPYTAPSEQNGVSVCPAKDGNHGGVVIIW